MPETESGKTKIGRIIIIATTITLMVILGVIYILITAAKTILQLALNMPAAQIFIGEDSGSTVLVVLAIIGLMFLPNVIGFIKRIINAVTPNTGNTQGPIYPADPNKNIRTTTNTDNTGKNVTWDHETCSKVLTDMIKMPDEKFIQTLGNTPEHEFEKFANQLNDQQLQKLKDKIRRAKISTGLANPGEYPDTDNTTGTKPQQTPTTNTTGDDGLDQILKEIDEETRHDWR